MRISPICLATGAAVLAQQASAGGFIEDSKASLTLRNLYINQDNREGTASPSKQEEWGQGFLFNYASGFTEGTVGVGVDALGLLGVKLDSGKGRHYNPTSSNYGGTVFPTDNDGRAKDDFGSLGLTGKVRISKTEGRIGTLLPKLPVVTYNDGRLLPQTFEGGQITSNEIAGLTLVGGQLEHAKGRNSSDARGLSIAGANNARSGQFVNTFYFAGGDYKVSDNLLAQYYYGNLEDFYQQHFVGLTHNWALPVGALKSDLRYFYSDSDGKNSSLAGRGEGFVSSGNWASNDPNKGEVDNRTWSAFFTYTLGGHAASLGYQQVSGDSAFPFLNQGDGATAYLITDRQIGKFLSAGERTWVAEYGFDFAKVGVPGLKATTTYLKGSNIETQGSDQGEWERDFRLDYVLQDGPLKGLGLSWRNAVLRSDAARDQDENRLILSYTLTLL
ncbi:OprD family porin [Metapseudomonas resinovorans]|uniref:Porin OprE n=1 Tax=Metapseudomonas resinovorans NBRC 106553 TaxID=1245471 RepID=S6AGC1_METRE|nr:OprD family porin [Pseudomonas resinovorans]BAN47005.1 porin OprE [Pseudomonas resinovorans NBRC 106553]